MSVLSSRVVPNFNAARNDYFKLGPGQLLPTNIPQLEAIQSLLAKSNGDPEQINFYDGWIHAELGMVKIGIDGRQFEAAAHLQSASQALAIGLATCKRTVNRLEATSDLALNDLAIATAQNSVTSTAEKRRLTSRVLADMIVHSYIEAKQKEATGNSATRDYTLMAELGFAGSILTANWFDQSYLPVPTAPRQRAPSKSIVPYSRLKARFNVFTYDAGNANPSAVTPVHVSSHADYKPYQVTGPIIEIRAGDELNCESVDDYAKLALQIYDHSFGGRTDYDFTTTQATVARALRP